MMRANIRIIIILATAFLDGTFLISTYRRVPSNSAGWSSLTPSRWGSSSGPGGANSVASTSQNEDDMYHTGRPGSGTAGGSGEDTMSEKEKEAAKDRLKVQYGDVTTTANKVKGQMVATSDAVEDQKYPEQTPSPQAQNYPVMKQSTPSGAAAGKNAGSTLKTVTKPSTGKETSAAGVDPSAEPFEEFAPAGGAEMTAVEYEDYLNPESTPSTLRRRPKTSLKPTIHPTAPGAAAPTDPWATYIDEMDATAAAPSPTSNKAGASKHRKPAAAATTKQTDGPTDALVPTTAVEYEDYLTDATPASSTAVEFADYVADGGATGAKHAAAAAATTHHLDIFEDAPASVHSTKKTAAKSTMKNALAAEATKAAVAAEEYLDQLGAELREES